MAATVSVQTIEIDCPPGGTRPGDLIDGVLEGTGLKAEKPVTMFFGCWVYEFKVSDEEWAEKITPVIWPRLEALYHSGAARYCSC